MNATHAYVAYAPCHCPVEFHADDRTDELTIKETSRWMFSQTKQGREMRRVLIDDVVINQCPHGNAPSSQYVPIEQQPLF